MKYFFSLVLLIATIACNDKKSEPLPATKTDSNTQVITTTPVNAVNPYATVDISPMDMSYYPVEFPKLKMAGKAGQGPLARVIYSRPHLQGRVLFKDVLKYGEPWRMGANEATEIQFFSDVTVQNKRIKAGRYVLYCIPQETEWAIVFNTNIDTWGLKPDPSKDAASFKVPIKKIETHLEYFTIIFEENDNSLNLLIAWDNVEARLPLKF
jgi:hypothetical protein